MLWGNIGAADRLDFTAIGPAVNLVSRLEGLCRPLGRSVPISGAVAAEATTPLVPLGEHVFAASRRPARSSPYRMRERLFASSASQVEFGANVGFATAKFRTLPDTYAVTPLGSRPPRPRGSV
jgi:class 3 adenylate cyclase